MNWPSPRPISESPSATADNWESYWDWFAVALFLLLTVDLLTTMGAAAVHGVAAEANPVMRLLLGQGVGVIVAVHVAILLGAVWGFAVLVRYGRRLEGRTAVRFRYSFEVWLGLLIAAGLVIYANNLATIVLGTSLL